MTRSSSLSRRTRRGSGLMCLAFLLALFIGASSPAAAALSKSCLSDSCCTYCDYYDSNGNWVASIYWCWSRCEPV